MGAYLNEHHIKSISGKDFKQNNIYYILTNKRYAGYYTYKGSAKKGGIPEIVSEELFERVQKMIVKTKKAPARAKAVGEKSMEMLKSKDLLPLTGYIHGGCSPIGMKKFFTTTVHYTAESLPTFCFSGGKIGWQVEMSLDDLKKLIHLQCADIIE